jgi:hypothetical protein
MRRVVVASSVLILLTGACGGGADPSASPATATSTSKTSAPVETSDGTSPEQTPARPTYAYPGGGPTDPVFPPGDEAYRLLSEGSCEELFNDTQAWDEQGVADAEGPNTIYLYRSAAEACLARWSEAVANFDRMSNPEFSDNCARNAVFEWLSRLIDARRADPDFSPIFVRSSERSTCPTEDSNSTPASTATSSNEGSG